jgi:hypothetical protein
VFNSTTSELQYTTSTVGRIYNTGNLSITGLTPNAWVYGALITLPFSNKNWKVEYSISTKFGLTSTADYLQMGCALYDSALIYPNIFSLSAGNNYIVAGGSTSIVSDACVSWTDYYNLAGNANTTFNVAFYMKNSSNTNTDIVYDLCFTCLT